MWAHMAAGIAAFFTLGAVIPIVAPLLVHATTNQRGPFFLYHLNQSAGFQLFMFLVSLALATFLGIVTVFTCGIGIFLFFLMGIPWLFAVIYPILMGSAAKSGQWSEYLVIGAKVKTMTSPPIK